jgi:polyisoprenoid-binding protein YceI
VLSGPVASVQAADVLGADLDISFHASSTLHDFDGAARPVSVELVADSGVSPLRWHAAVRVPVASLDTGNAKRDEKMRAMFDMEHFPVIRAELRDLDPDGVRESGRLAFLLTIRDVEHELEAEITNWQASPDRVEFDAEFDVSLDQYDLKAPRVLFIKVADRVDVEVHAIVRRSE